MTINEYEPICPSCGKAMILRKRKSDGSPFYGCAGYPNCFETMTVKQVERKANKIAASTEIRLNWAEQIRNKIAKKRHVNYYAYLKSPEWKRKKFEIEQSARYKCQVCNKGKSQAILNVHHRTYERLGCELPSDLIVLCRECHALYHGKLLPPQNEAQQSVQRTGGESGQQSLFSAGEVLPAKVTRQSPRR